MDSLAKIRYIRRKDDPSKFMSEAELYKASEGDPSREGKNQKQWLDHYAKVYPDEYEVFDSGALSAFGDMVRNTPKSLGNLVSGVFEAVSSPVKTANAMGALLTGQDFTYKPGDPTQEITFRGSDVRRAFVEAMKERYGSAEAIGNTIRTDPAGFLSDVALVPTGAGAALKGAGTAGRLAAKVAQKSGQTGRTTAAARFAASRASGAGSQMLHAADVIDPVTAVPMAATAGASRASAPLRAAAAKSLHDSLFGSSGGLRTAEDIREAQRLAWEEGVGPGDKGRAYINSEVRGDSTVRDQATAAAMATNDPSIMNIRRVDIVEPGPSLVAAVPGTKPLSALWDKAAAGRQADAFHAHTGYFDAANQFMGEKTAGRFGLDQTKRPSVGSSNNAYENAPYVGEFEPVEVVSGGSAPANPNDPALMMTVEQVNQQRKAANLRQSHFDAAQAGKMDDTTSQAMRKQEANFLMNNNARNLLYAKFEQAGIQPPKVGGKQLTWKEFGKRDRTLMNLEEMVESVQKNLEVQGVMAHLSPYFWSSMATTGYAAIGGPGGTPLAGMVAAIATAKLVASSSPDAASKILRYVGGQTGPAIPKPVWEAIKASAHVAQGSGRGKQLIERFLDKQIEKAPTVEEFVEKNPEAAASEGWSDNDE